MIAARRFGILHPVHTTNFLPVVDAERCTGCGKCVAACPVEAMALVSANDPQRPKKKRARLDDDDCASAAASASRACRPEALSPESRARAGHHARSIRSTGPSLMAIERGKLQNLIFDNQALGAIGPWRPSSASS